MSLNAKFIKIFSGFNLDFEISMENEIVVLFGPSGAGKSVTLKLIAGLLKPDDGFLNLEKRELYNHSSRINIKPQERNVGYVFQNHSLFPHMTVWQNIFFGAKGINRNEATLQTADMIKTFNLEGFENKYPNEISGGQQQRAALARSLIKKPLALLLDEPFSAVDNPLRRKMRLCLKNVMRKFCIPIILVTHDSHEALAMADRILIFQNGKITKKIKPTHETTINELEDSISVPASEA